jgi:hypothetical protein
MPRYAAKIDTNQPAIVEELRQVGASVESLARVGAGVPDLLVGFRERTYLLEIKTDRGALTDDQRAWLARWRGQAAVVRSADEALKAIGAL